MPKSKQPHGMTGKRNAYRGGPTTKVRSVSFPIPLLNKLVKKAKREKKTFSSVVVEEIEK